LLKGNKEIVENLAKRKPTAIILQAPGC